MIDLHLHLDGSLSVDTVTELARRQGIVLPDDLRPHLTVPENCESLNDYLRCFDFPLRLLQNPDSVEYAVRSLRRELAAEGVNYAEIRFAPALHTGNGHTQRAIIEGALAGNRGEGVWSNLILCCMRGADNREANLETVRLAAEYLGQGVVAADLAGAEALYPTEDFADVFDKARALSLPFTIHAGEAAGADSIRVALDMGAARIGHGVAAIHDAALMERLWDEQIPLEMCPTSNLQTGATDSMAKYPLKAFLRFGLCVTVNTDNRTVSDTDLAKEFDCLSLTAQEKRQVLENSITAAFLTTAEKDILSRSVFRETPVG